MISYEEARQDCDRLEIELLDTGVCIKGHFSNARIDRSTVPAGVYVYDLREGEDGEICSLESGVVTVNHFGTFLTYAKIEIPDGGILVVGEDIDYSFM